MNLSNNSVRQTPDYIRKSTRVPVSIVVEASGQALNICFARNISQTGMLLEVPTESQLPEIGQSLTLRFNLPFGKNIVQVFGKISTKGPTTDFSGNSILTVGIAFQNLDLIAQEEISNYINRYKTAQKEQVTAIKNQHVDQINDDEFKGKPVNHYLEMAKNYQPNRKTDDITDGTEKTFIFLFEKLSAEEKSLLLRGDPAHNQPTESTAAYDILRNALALFFKIHLEQTTVQHFLSTDLINMQPIVEEYHRLINFESDLCLEAIQQIQAQAQTSNNDPIKQLCLKIRERLVGALTNSKNLVTLTSQQKSQQTTSLHGPWGDIYPLEHYRQRLQAFFDGHITDPIEEGAIQLLLNSFHPLVSQALRGTLDEPNWRHVVQAALVTFKAKDELTRLRAVQGRHVEHIEAIRGIFRETAKLFNSTNEPLRKLFSLEGMKAPSAKDQERRTAVDSCAAVLLDSYSKLSDFTNLLIPGAVAIADENFQYTQGSFKEAVKHKVEKEKQGLSKSQLRILMITAVIFLAVAALHLKSMIIWKSPIEIDALRPPIPLLQAELQNKILVTQTPRKNWLELSIYQRQLKCQRLLENAQERGAKGLRLLDEQRLPLAGTVNSESGLVVQLHRLPEDDNLDANRKPPIVIEKAPVTE